MVTKASAIRVSLAYEFIEVQKNQYPVQILCRFPRMDRAGTTRGYTGHSLIGPSKTRVYIA